jgi:hypothetical protein
MASSQSVPSSFRDSRRLTASALAALLLFAPITLKMVREAGDFSVHIALAEQLLASHSLSAPHFLFQLLLLAVHAVVPLSMENAATVTMLLVYAATAAVIARFFIPRQIPPLACGALTASLLLAGQIYLLAPLDGHLYFGYLGINVYHNPTITLLRPLALVSFTYALAALSAPDHGPHRSWIACALVSTAAALTKPNLTICLLPALGLLLLWRLRRRERPQWQLLLLGFFLPALIILPLQFLLTYSGNQLEGVYAGKSEVVLAPLAFMGARSSWLGVKFFLSALFPFTVLITHGRSALKDPGMQLAWLLFLIGAGYTYLLAEAGPRLLHGNFSWSGQISLFILFCQSTRFLLQRETPPAGRARGREQRLRLLCFGALALHLLAGAGFYLAEFIDTERFW